MGLVYVKTFAEMAFENTRFMQRYKNAQSRILQRSVERNEVRSKEIVKKRNFKGVLFSGINIKKVDKLTFRLISSAPHSLWMEEGVKEHLVHRDQLNGWLEAKYPEYKGNAILVGRRGSPYSFIKKPGIRFMENGFNHSLQFLDMEIAGEFALL